MKDIILTLTLGLILSQSQAQKSINFSGQIKNLKTAESIYLGLGRTLIQLKLLEDGAFSTNANIQQSPSFFYFAKLSKKGKVELQTPRIWFDKDSIEVNFDWLDKSFQILSKMPYQSMSEKIETLNGDNQTEFILSNPINIPILYFVNENKDKISISNLEAFCQKVDEIYQSSIYFKELTNYLSAKKRTPIKIGGIVEDFTLPNKDGTQVSVVNKGAKTTLITMFSSACYYSIESISLLEQLTKINNGKIEIITIWADDTKDSWLNAHLDQKNKITWTNILDEYGFASTYFQNTGWPTFYVIDAEGRLIDIFNNYSQKTANKLKDLTK
jgi:peroxiredoxin